MQRCERDREEEHPAGVAAGRVAGYRECVTGGAGGPARASRVTHSNDQHHLDAERIGWRVRRHGQAVSRCRILRCCGSLLRQCRGACAVRHAVALLPRPRLQAKQSQRAGRAGIRTRACDSTPSPAESRVALRDASRVESTRRGRAIAGDGTPDRAAVGRRAVWPRPRRARASGLSQRSEAPGGGAEHRAERVPHSLSARARISRYG